MALVLNNKASGNVLYTLNKERISIGRDEGNDLVLADDRVSGFHCSLFYENGEIELVDLGSSNGTFVNGEWLSGRRKLAVWDVIRLGDMDLELVDTEKRRGTLEQPAVSVPEAKPVQSNMSGKEFGQMLLIEGDDKMPIRLSVTSRVTVGRSTENSHVLPSSMVSSRHACLHVDEDEAWLEDLNSTNGTFVNDERINSKTRVYDGDVVKFDDISYRLVLPMIQRPAPEPAKTTVRPAIQAEAIAIKTSVRPAIDAAAAAVQSHAQPAAQETGKQPSVSAETRVQNAAPIQQASEASNKVTRVQSKAAPIPPQAPSSARSESYNAPSETPAPAFENNQARSTSAASNSQRPGLQGGAYLRWLYGSWQGTALRSDFWKALILIGVLHWAAQLVAASLIYQDINSAFEAFALASSGLFKPLHGAYVIMFWLLYLTFQYFMVCVITKRLRDRGRPPQFAWAFPILGVAYILLSPALIHSNPNVGQVILFFVVSLMNLWLLIEVGFLRGRTVRA